jgi:orotidine-5'-phosphate decarboxylase
MSSAAPSFLERLSSRWHGEGTLLCVGLDPDPARMPAQLAGRTDAMYLFCREIVDATADLVCAFKPQIAYFAAAGAEDQLALLIAHIRARHPKIPVILDAKRGDIGPTAQQYAREAFERHGADAVTLSPYMGFDSIEPFLASPRHGAFLLCRTSNAGGSELQMLDAGGQPLYERVAALAAGRWNVNGQLGLVVGATFPQQLGRVRALAPALPLLVPGIGAQGGDLEATLQAGLSAQGDGLVINSSRAILYAGGGETFALEARVAALHTRDQIESVRRRLMAGR